MGFGNLTNPPGLMADSSSWRYSFLNETDPFNRTFSSPSNPYLDLGWTSTPNRMISYDGCSALVPGISNVGVSTGFVFRWLNVTEGCPRLLPPTPTAPSSPVSPPTTQSVLSPGMIAVIVVVSAVVVIFIGAIVGVYCTMW
jgi:hypothetical protein